MAAPQRTTSSRSRKPELDVTVQLATTRTGVPHARNLRQWAAHAFAIGNGAIRDPRVHVVIRIVDRRESRVLNRTWRDKDKPTNVLSFPAGDLVADGVRELGDIVICARIVADEARAQGKPLTAHWAHMVVHGILHLLGYDHIRTRDAVVMERCEARILAEFDHPDPYLSLA